MVDKRNTRTFCIVLAVCLSVLLGIPTANANISESSHTISSTAPEAASASNATYLPLVSNRLDPGYPSGADWPMLAANAQRTSWTPEEVRGDLSVAWYRPIEPYIPYKVQPIAANGKIYVSSAKGLYALNASNGNVDWVYPTELPLGNSPTVATVNGKSIAYVGGYDRKIHAIDALTGVDLTGYASFEAQAGFETNPVVMNNTVYVGNRDGSFYALNAVTGSLVWSFKTDGPILFSAAYKDGVLYFASQDAHAYALNALDGSLIWKSQKLPGAGFHSFWPVIYTDKLSGKAYVTFGGSENYRASENIGLVNLDEGSLFPLCSYPSTCPWGARIGPTTSVPAGDSYWMPGTALVDVSAITDYYEKYGYRRTDFILDSQTGQEYTFDSNGNGISEYAPFAWSNETQSGNRYPPVVNGIDGIYYDHTMYLSAPVIPRGDIVGWKFGTHQISTVEASGLGHAVDEPMAYSSGGKLIYWSLCCDRSAGAVDITMPYGQPVRSWTYYTYDLMNKAPGYSAMYSDGTTISDADPYSGKNQSKNGVYGKHGTTQSPPVPYQGKVYFLRSNTLLAFSPTATTPVSLPLAAIVPVQSSPTPLPTSQLQQRLETEVQKMIAAGPLRPGYHSAGFTDNFGDGQHTDTTREFGEIFDYFQNPSDTIVTLIQALPYLSTGTQQQVKTYLQTYYGQGTTYDFTKIVHIGFGTGAPRETFTTPPEEFFPKNTFGIGANYQSPMNPSTTPICGSCGYWTTFPPYSFYAAWKYAQVFGGASSILSAMSGKLNTPPADSYLTMRPYILNLYIAGYHGYLQLQQLAGVPQNPSVQSTYSRLLNLRVMNFTSVFKDTPFPSGLPDETSYNNTLAVARNFMFLTPELADYMNRMVPSEVQSAINEYTYVAPYWFVPKFDNSYYEGTFQHLYDSPALFQAKAYILKQPYTELVKYLDVPAFYQGDLFHIQNLVAALRASATP